MVLLPSVRVSFFIVIVVCFDNVASHLTIIWLFLIYIYIWIR
jgi:hypothetical protein